MNNLTVIKYIFKYINKYEQQTHNTGTAKL